MNIEVLKGAVEKASCWSDVLRSMDLNISGFMRDKIKRICEANSISTDHFDPKTAMRRNKLTLSFDQIFCVDSAVARSSLRQLAIKHGLYISTCARCGAGDTWRGSPLRLELDHIDGNCNNNVVANLRWLCPNCHSQTDSYRKAKALRKNEGS